MNLQLNLATRVYVDFRKVNLLIALLFLLACGWCSYEIYVVASNNEESQRLSGFMAKSVAKGSGKISDAEFNKLMANIKIANTILDKKGVDWLSLLDNLELVVPEGIALTGLAPADKGNGFKVSGTARTFSAVKKFIENLESSAKFADVYLTDQSQVKEGSAVKGIGFTVTCRALIQ